MVAFIATPVIAVSILYAIVIVLNDRGIKTGNIILILLIMIMMILMIFAGICLKLNI